VAELLLTRTKAAQVAPVFREVRARYSTPGELVDAGPEAANAIIAGLGLHWRGPLLYGAARAVAGHGGTPPDDLDALRSLPGIGPYAAAAWLSLHRGRRAVLIDNNVARWLARLTGRPYDGETRRKRWLQELAEMLTPQQNFRAYNYAVLDFTMTVCTPRTPRCPTCPLRADCAYGQTGAIAAAPEPLQ
jgi:A/G-specific adenine glycosylase